MKKILAFLFFFFLATNVPAQEHALFTALLKDHVHEGAVTYPQLCRDPRLPQYIRELSRRDPESIPEKNGQMAFWINAYNAFTLKLICRHYPVKSINEIHTGGLLLGSLLGRTAWDKKFITINGRSYSLGEIEHKILRPKFQEPRIHFAIVCAAKGCPPLRSEAYEPAILDAQMDDQARAFLNQKDKNRFDLAKRTAYLSPIFSWFKKDFGGRSPAVLKFLHLWLPQDIRDDIEKNSDAWTVRFTPYDWSLNE